MKLRMFQVDVFSPDVLSGNPAAVCPLDAWLPDATLQAIARENNLSETAFFVPNADGSRRLRWFTPTTEVELCGHATMAAAFVAWNCLDDTAARLEFDTRSGRLGVERRDGRLTLDLPRAKVTPLEDIPSALWAGLGTGITEVLACGTGKQHDTWVVVYETEATVRGLKPDFSTLLDLGPVAINPTAPGDTVDFVSRYFAPAFGIDEDPATGSAHSALAVIWSERLGRNRLEARQVSARGGDIECEVRPDTVVVSGHAVLYMDGAIAL